MYERRYKARPYRSENNSFYIVTGDDIRFGVDEVTASNGVFKVNGHPATEGVPFEIKVKVVSNGHIYCKDELISVIKAIETNLYISICVGAEAEIPEIDYDILKQRHITDHKSLMERSYITFGKDAFSHISVDKRLSRLQNDENAIDPWLNSDKELNYLSTVS